MTDLQEWRGRREKMSFDCRAFINGRRVSSRVEESADCIGPADAKYLYSLPVGSAEDADAAVSAAADAFEGGAWSSLSPLVRKSILQGFAAAIDKERDQLALYDCVEMGKPISLALGDVDACGHIVRFFAEYADKIGGSTAVSAPRLVQYTRREPRGVVAAIVPWNYPLPNAALKIAPALAAGNSVVLKPSELSSSSALRLAEIAAACGIPPGVFNVVPGLGRTVGAALASHRRVDCLAFTGSTKTGRTLMRLVAAGGLKAMQLECGGKSANIVFPDCGDLRAVARDAAARIFANQGQLCVAGTRLIVHQSIREELVALIAGIAANLHIGDPLDPETNFGPLASASRVAEVQAHTRAGIAAGATLRFGGGAVSDRAGFFVEPTILTDVLPAMAIAQDDIFGPVLTVLGFDSNDEAVKVANSTSYGLSASVWTRDLSTAQQMIVRLKAGRVSVLAGEPDPGAFGFPMGAEPVAQSGFGVEGGREGCEAFTSLKAVEINV